MDDTKELSYDVIGHIGTFQQKGNYSKEVNVISWKGRRTVYDIRTFRTADDGKKYPLKGICLNRAELAALKELLNSIDLEVCHAETEI